VTPRFRAAGIEVVTIGTDDADEVRAARQAAFENGVDPLHFDVLCDPDAETFRRWGAWDEFRREALHGTFLVDGRGRILWQDISTVPFEDSAWLLAECQRLLKAWQ
jgi:alkyl hydroperoxide reductase subunit AhpC